MIESPPPRTPSVSKTEKENVSLADTFRSPDLDTSYSKGQWHRIAIQAAARAKGELYQEWKELPLTHALDLQPDGQQMMAGAAVDSTEIKTCSAMYDAAHSTANSREESAHAARLDPTHDASTAPKETHEIPGPGKQQGTHDTGQDGKQPLDFADACTDSTGAAAASLCGSRVTAQAQSSAQEDASGAHAGAGPPSEGQASEVACSTQEPASEQCSSSAPADTAIACPKSAARGGPCEGDSVQPAHMRKLSGASSNASASSGNPSAAEGGPSESSSVQPAHGRKLSGGSSKGSITSGNPYASSCAGSTAGSTGGSPAGSLRAPEGSQGHLQHQLSGNPFAPPGTLRTRPVSPVMEGKPCHARSISLPPTDLTLPAPAALADYAASLSLPHPSLTALTGAQLYQMHQSPLPEEGETFRPAKDILQELFFNRAPQSQALPPESSLQPEQTQEQQADQRVESSPTDGPKDALGAAAERVDALSLEGTLPEQAQSWEPMWGSSSSKVPPASDLDPSAKLLGDPPGAAHTKRGSQGKGTWEAAWGEFQASEVPDQAAGSASRKPEQDAAAWGTEWDFATAATTSAPAQPDFTLLLPSREPPPPPAPPAGVDCTAPRDAASAAQREAVAARPERPLPVMRPEDRHKCERAFKQGYADKGGVSASAAQPLHAKSGCKAPFEAIWELVSPGSHVSASLDCSSFCLFMHLLKTSIKGFQLPASISPEEARALLGLSANDTTASQPAEPAAPGPDSSSEGNSANRVRQGAHAQSFSFFQPFQSGMQQGAPGRRPATAESPSRIALSRSGAAASLVRPASAASESSMTHPALSPCGALVAKALQEANREAHREGAGQVWQPLASRQLDSWAATSAPAHALSAPVQSLQHVPSLPHQGALRRNMTDIPSPRRACPAAPYPRSSESSPDIRIAARLRRTSLTSDAGCERLTITVDGAKLEYSKSLDRPIFSVSLHDASGKRLEAPQDTPPGHLDRRSHTIAAGHEVQFRTPMNQMPPESVVYVEVKHWKSLSKKMSTLGWSFAPIEMFIDVSSEQPTSRAGQLYLHLYKKPVSFTAHLKDGQLKQLHSKGHDLFLTLR